jgi:hypothetical protein
MKVRNFALTIAGAVLAGATFSIKEQVELVFRGLHIPLATLLLGAGIVVWCAFYLMDRHWYHKLLIGAVNHGLYIERRYHEQIPELGLATAIGTASPTVLKFGVTKKSNGKLGRQWKIRSSTKLNLFYGTGIVLLIIAALGSLWIVGKDPDKKIDTVTNGKTGSSNASNSTQGVSSSTSAKERVPESTRITPDIDTGVQKELPTTVPANPSPVDVTSDDQCEKKPKRTRAEPQ